MSREADELSQAIERLLVAQRSDIVTAWVLGNFGPNFGIKVGLRDGRAFEALGPTISSAIDKLIAELAKATDGASQ